jgi:hypothetical protein
MEKIFVILIISAFAISANGQDSSGNSINTSPGIKINDTYNGSPTLDKSFIWSVGIEPSIPVGHFHNLAGFGFGASLQGEIKASKNVGITINGGYIAYSGKTVDTISYSSFKYWPLMGGLKLYMGKAYVHGQAGAGFGSNGLGTSFWYGGGLGVNLSKRIDAELRYAGWKQNLVNTNGGGVYGNGGTTGGYGGHYSTMGLRIAVNF